MVQHSVDAWFDTHAVEWRDIYEQHSVWAMIHQLRLQAALSHVDGLILGPGARVLDLGCGAGLAAVALAGRGFRVVAIDPAFAMVSLARQQALSKGAANALHVALGDAHTLGFKPQTFDLVVSLGVIPWLHSPGAALQEMSRVLRPGGHVIVNADNRARLSYLLDPRRNVQLAPLRRALRHRPASDGDARLHRLTEFDCLLAAAGLFKIHGSTLGFGPFTFLGHEALPPRAGLWLHQRLQRVADRGVPVVRSVGSQYLVVARKGASTDD